MRKLVAFLIACLFPFCLFLGMVLWLSWPNQKELSSDIVSTPPLTAPVFTQSHEIFFYAEEDQTIHIGKIEKNKFMTTDFRRLEFAIDVLALSPSPNNNAFSLLTSDKIIVLQKTGDPMYLPQDSKSFLWSPNGSQYLYQTLPDDSNQSEVHIVSLSNPTNPRIISLDLSDRMETSGNITLVWLNEEKILYAPESTDGGGSFFWNLESGSDHRTSPPSLFTEIFRIDFSPSRRFVLVDMLSPESEEDHLYGLIDLVTNKKTITSISTDSTLCNWANETDWLCLTEGKKDRSQIGLLNPQTGNYQLLGFAQTIKREKLKQLSYHEATKELLLLYVDDDKIHRIEF